MMKHEIIESNIIAEVSPNKYNLPSLIGKNLVHKKNCRGFKMSRSPLKSIDKM